MQLLAVLVSNDAASRSSRISSEDTTTLGKSYHMSVIGHRGKQFSTYVEDDAADGRTSLRVARLRGLRLALQRSVAQAVVVVEATEGHLIQVVQFHHFLLLFN